MKLWVRRVLKADARLSGALRVSEGRHVFVFLLKFFAHSGDSWFWLAGLFLVWLLSQGEWRARAAFLGIGLVIMAAAVIVLKFAIRRPRPEGEWGQVYRITDPHSFPSGHAARSAALAVMGVALGPPWFGLTLVLWAPWVGISRVALGVHYLSDVVVGWFVGGLMALIALGLRPLVERFLGFLL